MPRSCPTLPPALPLPTACCDTSWDHGSGAARPSPSMCHRTNRDSILLGGVMRRTGDGTPPRRRVQSARAAGATRARLCNKSTPFSGFATSLLPPSASRGCQTTRPTGSGADASRSAPPGSLPRPFGRRFAPCLPSLGDLACAPQDPPRQPPTRPTAARRPRTALPELLPCLHHAPRPCA